MGRRDRPSRTKRKELKQRKAQGTQQRLDRVRGLPKVEEWTAGWLSMAEAGRMLVFYELPRGIVGIFHEEPDGPPLTVVRELEAACDDPMFGLARRPERVRTADEALAAALREVPNLTVVVEPTPLIAKFEAKLRNLGEADDELVHDEQDGKEAKLDGEQAEPDASEDEEQIHELLPDALPEDVSRSFYSAALALDDEELWKCVVDAKAIAASVPELGRAGLQVVPLRGDGQPQAVLIFDSKETAEEYDREYWGELDAPVDHLALIYESALSLTGLQHTKLSAREPAFAKREAVPVLSRVQAKGETLPPTELDVRLATAIVAGLGVVLSTQGDLLSGARSEDETLLVGTPRQPAVEFTIPAWDGTPAHEFAELAAEDLERQAYQRRREAMLVSPEREAALKRLSAAGRNDPCPCGSQKKYKKCHLAGDEDLRQARPGTAL